MPYTVKVRGPLARYLLGHPHAGLRRRLSILRLTPFPPGSRSLHADAAWYALANRFPNLRAFVYGTVFDDTLSLTISDPDHSVGEERYLLLGMPASSSRGGSRRERRVGPHHQCTTSKQSREARL